MRPAFLVVVALAGCAPSRTANPPPPPSTEPGERGELAGRVERSNIDGIAAWKSTTSTVDDDAARALAKVPPGATVRVFFGAWCGDSRREVKRFLAALDRAGAVPFTIDYIAVDHELSAPDGLTDSAGLRFVPTFVVLRDGKEVGRVIESAKTTIEGDLGALLRGEQSGVLSGRSDL